MSEFIIVPGIGGSGEAHWQTRWQQANPAMRRFSPADWHRPDLDDWIAALDLAIAAASAPPVLIAHSLGCLLVAHWQLASRRACAGALLVAVPDPAKPGTFFADFTDAAQTALDRFRDAGMNIVKTRVPVADWPGFAD